MKCAPTLIALDAAVIGVASVGAGSSWAATSIRIGLVLVCFGAAGLYRPRLQFSTLDDLPALSLGLVVALALGALLPVPTLLTPPGFAALPPAWPAVMLASVLTGRALVNVALRHRRRHAPGESTIIVGTGDEAVRLAEVLTEDRTYGLTPLGLVGPQPLTGPNLPVPRLGSIDDLDALVTRHHPRNLIVAHAGDADAGLVTTLRQCRRAGITVYVVPRLFELSLGRHGVELVQGIPLYRLRPEPARLRRWAVKRFVDIVGAAIGLVVLSPVIAICALAVRWESGRAGVFFRQERIGRDGKPFTLVKFRSLTPASELESQVMWNIKCDERVGPVGRVLRSTSLDELPQLLNVLRGHMSLVGPRPERPYFVEQFTRMYGGYIDRHRVPAGITGWAQIHGLRGDTSIEERVRFDNFYIENWSLGLDLKIMIRTFTSMLGLERR